MAGIKAAAVKTVGFEPRGPRRSKPLSDSTLEVLEAKRQAFKAAKAQPRDAAAWTEYRAAKGRAAAAITADLDSHVDQQAGNIQQLMDQKRVHDAWKGINQLAGKARKRNRAEQGLLSKDGKLLEDQEEQRKRMAEHYYELLNVNRAVNLTRVPIPKISFSGWDKVSVEAPTVVEVAKAITALKTYRAPGLDGIPAELLKAGDHKLVEWVHRVLSVVWKQGKAPADWKRAVISSIPKKGDQRVCDNQRGISVLSVPGKVYCLVLMQRMQAVLLGDAMMEQQAAFRPGRGTTDHLFTLSQLQQKAHRHRQELHLCYIDLAKAYDSVDRTTLWKVLELYGVPRKLVDLLTDLHDGTEACVRHAGGLSDWFPITTGVRQGCVIAPMLFNVYMDIIMRTTLARCPAECGVEVHYKVDGKLKRLPKDRLNSVERLTCLLYADDVVLIAKDRQQLVEMLKAFDDTALAFGMCVNISKTKIQTVGGTAVRSEQRGDDGEGDDGSDDSVEAEAAEWHPGQQQQDNTTPVAADDPEEDDWPCLICADVSSTQSPLVQCSCCDYAFHISCMPRAAAAAMRSADGWTCADCVNGKMAAAAPTAKQRDRILAKGQPCLRCSKFQPVATMLLCEGCDRGMHLTCLRPALEEVPEGDWFCAACMAVQRRESAGTAREDDASRRALSAPGVQQPAAPPPPPIKLRGAPVEDVEMFKYLGCFITTDGRLQKELSHRIGAAAGAFHTLAQVWSNRHIRLHTKGKLYRAAVLSNLLYGAESWNVSKSHIQQLHTFHMTCLRRIMGIARLNRVSNTEVLRRCGQQPMETLLRIYRLRWLGHLGRMKDTRLPKQMLFGKLTGRLPKGGQRKQWQALAAEDLQHTKLGHKSWHVKCIDRDYWNGLVNDLKVNGS